MWSVRAEGGDGACAGYPARYARPLRAKESPSAKKSTCNRPDLPRTRPRRGPLATAGRGRTRLSRVHGTGAGFVASWPPPPPPRGGRGRVRPRGVDLDALPATPIRPPGTPLIARIPFRVPHRARSRGWTSPRTARADRPETPRTGRTGPRLDDRVRGPIDPRNLVWRRGFSGVRPESGAGIDHFRGSAGDGAPGRRRGSFRGTPRSAAFAGEIVRGDAARIPRVHDVAKLRDVPQDPTDEPPPPRDPRGVSFRGIG